MMAHEGRRTRQRRRSVNGLCLGLGAASAGTACLYATQKQGGCKKQPVKR